MKLLRCENMHFYDGDKFTVCPYCSNSVGDTSLNRFDDMGDSLKAVENTSSTVESVYRPTEIIDKD